MSRLDSFIRRVMAQRTALNQIVDLVAERGPIVELGLGNGRTYDHLVEQYGAGRIMVFDRDEWPRNVKTPRPGSFIVGDIKDTGKLYKGLNAALVHADIGAGDDDIDRCTLTWLPPLIDLMAAPQALVLSGLPLDTPSLRPLELYDVLEGRYFLYRKERPPFWSAPD